MTTDIKEKSELESIFDIQVNQLPITIPVKNPDEVITKDNESIEMPNADGTPKTNEDLEQIDFEYARKTLRIAIEAGKDALENISELSETSEHPRTHEVVGELLTHITNSTKELLGLHKIRKDLKKNTDGSTPSSTVNNTLLVTTHDLIKLMKEQKNAK